MPLLTRKRVILAKIETTYGTDPTPTGAANAILVRNLNVTPQSSQLVGRDVIRPYLGNSEQLLASTHVELDFEVEMAGSGTAGTAPAYGPLLRACGLAETTTASVKVEYKPVSASFESVTIYFNVDGILHKITGARGDVELSISTGQIPVYKFKFVGIYNAPTDTALPVVSYTAFQSPLVANSTNTPTFSFFSVSAIMKELSLQVGNQVDYRNLISSQYVQLTDRKSAGQVTFEANTIATKDWFTTALASTLGALSLTHGTVAGNKVLITSSTVDLIQPNYTDDGGVQMIQCGYVLTPTTAGNDEFTISVQ
jgi:hypothetical protein